MRSFYILNRRATSPGTPELNGAGTTAQRNKRARLRYRDIIWAFHSESQEILLQASMSACEGKMNWSDAKALGIFLWLHSLDSLVSSLMDIVVTLINTTVESAYGGCSAEPIHDRRGERSDCLFVILFCVGKNEARAWSLEASSLAQGAGCYAQISGKRLYTSSVANRGVEERVCSHEQAAFR